MPSVETNKSVWGDDYAWPQRGDEWSAPWGSATTQWHCVILPRIRTFLPASTVLEIAPGYGRWTQFLQPEAQRLIVVDLSESCIEACKSRFAEATNISYHVNDGKSLAMVVDESVDFAFSFDSLVHADLDVLRAYLSGTQQEAVPGRRGVPASLEYWRLYPSLGHPESPSSEPEEGSRTSSVRWLRA